MYGYLIQFCPNCGEKSPATYYDVDPKSHKKVARYICIKCRCSIQTTMNSEGDAIISIKQDGHYKI